MRLWYKACPRCQGDLARSPDISGASYVKCLQCGMELNPAQEASLLRVGYVREAAARQTAPPVQTEGWRHWKSVTRTG